MRKIWTCEVLDTGAGPNFVCLSRLPSTEVHIKPGDKPVISEVNGRALNIMGTTNLFVILGAYEVKDKFYV